MMSKIFCLIIVSIVNLDLLISQTYCLEINTVDNGATVTFNWSISTSQIVAASIEVLGTGILSSNSEIIGGFSSNAFSGSFIWNKSMPTGAYGYTTDDAAPFGVVLASPPNTRFSQSCALPITLSTFSAIQHSDRASKLDWTTSSEINSDYFGIERSRDGDIWETIGKVTAAGNSNTELAYEYIDNLLPFSRTADQIFYYRLRLTDQDGSFKYSDIKGVNFNRQTSDGVIAVYPNPATQMVHIDIVGMDESQVETKLRIFDMYGRVMLDKAILGSGLEPVDVLQYPSGVYNISVTQGDKLHQKQFIKVE